VRANPVCVNSKHSVTLHGIRFLTKVIPYSHTGAFASATKFRISDIFFHRNTLARRRPEKSLRLAAAENGTAHANRFSIPVFSLVFSKKIFVLGASGFFEKEIVVGAGPMSLLTA